MSKSQATYFLPNDDPRMIIITNDSGRSNPRLETIRAKTILAGKRLTNELTNDGRQDGERRRHRVIAQFIFLGPVVRVEVNAPWLSIECIYL